ncbi:MAG TPA: ABC transporter permease [Anaerolineae bacterium]|nr:ABC transporter permease [Anaerolineae bacterium]
MTTATDTSPKDLDLAAQRSRSPLRDALTQFLKNKVALAALIFIIIEVIIAIPPVTDLVAPFPYDKTSLYDNLAPPGSPYTGRDPEFQGKVFILGADYLGRDLLSRTLYGAQVSLAVGFVGATVSLLVGMLVGLISGYSRPAIDNLIMRLVDFLYALPILVFIILMQVYFKAVARKESAEGLEPFTLPSWFGWVMFTLFAVALIAGIYMARREDGGGAQYLFVFLAGAMFASFLLFVILVMRTGRSFMASLVEIDNAFGGMFFLFIALGLLNWIGMARITRGQVLSVKNKEYVEAAKAIGATDRRIIFQHILPNVLGPAIIYETLAIPGYIFTEAFLSFIGLGINPPRPSWGNMISENYQGLRAAPWTVLVPSVALTITVLAFNFLGDGLRDAFDPRLRGE